MSAFHALSTFGVHVKLAQKVKTLPFPPYAFYSHNHYNPGWSLNTHRRLKNVIVMLEWVPGAIAALPAPTPQPDREQQAVLQRALNMFDVRSSGRSLDANGLDDALMALNVPQHERLAAARELGMDEARRSQVAVDVMGKAIASRSVYAMQSGRFYAVLSLPEAEACRAILHSRLGQHPVAEHPATQIAIHSVAYSGLPIDAAMALPQPRGGYQREMIRQALRFVDSEHSFPDQAVDAVLRAEVQRSNTALRHDWYEEVRSSRRRQKVMARSLTDDPFFISSGVAAIFRVRDEFDRLALRATRARVKHLIAARGLHVVDAFRAFNSSHTGQMTCGELWGGKCHVLCHPKWTDSRRS